MRILWLTENYFPGTGGMAQSCDRITWGLRNRAVEIEVVHFVRNRSEISVEEAGSGRNIRIPVENDPAHSLNLLWNFLQSSQSRQPYTHLVAFGGYLPVLAGPIFSAWLNCPLVILIRGNDFDEALFSYKRQPVLREALLASSYVGVVSKDKAEKIKPLFPGVQVRHLPNGIDLDNWQLLESERQFGEQYRQDKEKLVLGVFGHLKSKKGILFLLECLVASGHANQIHLLAVGELEERVRDWLEEAPARVSYDVLPFMDRYDLIRYYGACDVVAIPSHYDGLPNVMLEACGLGKPILASRVAGMADFLEDEVHGLLFHPGDSQSCRDALNRMMEKRRAGLVEMGKAAYAMIRSALTAEKEIDNYMELFSSYAYATSSPNPVSG